MTAKNRAALEALFETGDTLLQTSFTDLIDSCLNIADTAAQTVASQITFSKAVNVNSGGTGVSALTAYSVVCGGTSTTGKIQSVDTSGATQDYVLTYTSAAGLPKWAPNSAVGGVVAIANGGTGSATAASAFSALKQNADTSTTGVVEIATTAEAQTGTDTGRVITPSNLAGTRFVSTGQTITAGGSLTLAHGLGGVPSYSQCYLVCVSADNGYSVSDVVIGNCGGGNYTQGATPQGVVIIPDATNLNIRFANDGTAVFTGLNKTTGNAIDFINTNWNAFFVARRP